MRIVTGDECGLLKEFIPEIAHKKLSQENDNSKKSNIVLPVSHDNIQNINNRHGIQRVDPDEIQTRNRGVVDMTLVSASSDNNDFAFACLRYNGCVEVWNGHQSSSSSSKTSSSNSSSLRRKSKFAQYQRVSLTGNIFTTIHNKSPIIASGSNSSSCDIPVKPLAISSIQNEDNNSTKLVACDTHGNLVILKTHHDLEEEKISPKPPSILHQCSVFSNTPDSCSLTYTKGKVVNTQFASTMAVNNSVVAIGGRERDVRVLDLTTCQTMWKAKNLPPDPQTLLQQPVWPSAMQFLSSSSNNTGGNANTNLLAVGTGFGQVRLYDVRSQPAASIIRRPLRYTPTEHKSAIQHRITALCQTSLHDIVVGDTTGDLHTLDLRYNFNGQLGNKQNDGSASLGRYVGPAGSIRSLQKHPTLPILAAVGCDRILRTYNTKMHKIINCVYLKQRLNCVLMTPEEGTWKDDNNNNDSENGHDDEDDNADRYGSDMDQEDDIVEDFVDSSDEDNDYVNNNKGNTNSSSSGDDSDDSDDDGGGEEEDAEEGNSKLDPSALKESDHESNDDDDDDQPGDDSFPRSGKNKISRSKSDSESDSESEESSEDGAPPKKRKR